MPTVRQAIIAAWMTLPEDVRTYGPFRNRDHVDEPSSSARKTILVELLRDLQLYESPQRKKSFAALHWGEPNDPSSSPSVTSDGANQIRTRLTDSAQLLSHTRSWHEALLAKHRQDPNSRGDKREALLLPSLALARKTQSAYLPERERHQELVESEIHRGKSRAAGEAWAEIRLYLRAESESLQTQLNSSWAARRERVPNATEGLDDARSRFLDAAFTAAGKWSTPAWGDPDWAEGEYLAEAQCDLSRVVHCADEASCPWVSGLSRTAQPTQPPLLGVQTRKQRAVPSLDRSIEARLYAAFKSDSLAVATAESDGRDLSEAVGNLAPDWVMHTVRASAAPLGLALASGRAVVLLMDRMIEHVQWQPVERGEDAGSGRTAVSSRDAARNRLTYEFDKYFFDEWQKRGDQFFAKTLRGGKPSPRHSSDDSDDAAGSYEEQQGLALGGHTVLLGSQMNAVLENPRWLFMSAAWLRAFRLELAVEGIPDARSAWSVLRRAFSSVYDDALTLAAARAKRGESAFIDPFADIQAPSSVRLTSTARDDVLRLAARTHGASSLVVFIEGLRTRSVTTEASWNTWVNEHAQYTNRENLDEYSTFDQVVTHLQDKAIPALDGVAEVLACAQQAGVDMRTLKAIGKRMQAGNTKSNDADRWEGWRSARAGEIAELAVQDLIKTVEALPGFAAACELVAGSPGSE